MTKRLSQNMVNLEQFPTIAHDVAEQITIGDLHANALKLLHLLIQEGVLLTSPEQYHTFSRLYQIPAEHITPEELTALLTIIDTLEVQNPNIFIRFIGDEHFDRGSNDLYIDMILKKLRQEDIDYEIILSNHGARSILQIESFREGETLYNLDIENEYGQLQTQEISIYEQIFDVNDDIFKILQEFEDEHPIPKLYHLHFARIEAFINSSKLNDSLSHEQIEEAKGIWGEQDQKYKHFYLAQPFDSSLYQFYFALEKQLDAYKNLAEVKSLSRTAQIMLAQRSSFRNLNILLERDLIRMDAIEALYDNYYTPSLKLLSYSIDPQSHTLTLFSHAPCGLACIQKIAEFFSIPFQNHTLASFAQTLDAINLRFINQYVHKGRISALLDSSSMIYQFIWNREYDRLLRPQNIFDYHLNFVHGHDNDEEHRPAHVYCLDSRLGSITMLQAIIEPVMSGEDLVLKSQGEYNLSHLIESRQQAFLRIITDAITISANSGHDAWRLSFATLSQIFKSFMTYDASFESYIAIYCKLIQATQPRLPWTIIEPQISCLEKMIPFLPNLKMVSAFSIFSNQFSTISLQTKLDHLKTFLQAENTNTIPLQLI